MMLASLSIIYLFILFIYPNNHGLHLSLAQIKNRYPLSGLSREKTVSTVYRWISCLALTAPTGGRKLSNQWNRLKIEIHSIKLGIKFFQIPFSALLLSLHNPVARAARATGLCRLNKNAMQSEYFGKRAKCGLGGA